MKGFLIEMLECPVCHGDLNWKIKRCCQDRIEEAEINCKKCSENYSVKEGIGLFLTPELPRNDLWEELNSQLSKYLSENPEIKNKLMETPLNNLNPADQFFRAQILEEEGKFIQAKAVFNLAYSKLYTPDYQKCYQAQINYLKARLSTNKEPIIDLASGRGELAEILLRQFTQPIVLTDFSPRVLRQNQKRLKFYGLYEQVSLLAFDVRRTPFKDRAIKVMTTNLGLPNIEGPDQLLFELRRIIAGDFLAISYFFDEDDKENATFIKESRLDQFLFLRTTLEFFYASGWQVKTENMMLGKVSPTPASEILEGTRIDTLPLTETKLKWCVIAAT